MTDDIRDHYDIRGPQADIVAAILEGRPPQFSNRDARPGFDCLIVVLRRIFSHIMLGPVPAIDWLAASEKENPILRFAWGLFGDGEAEVKSANKARYKVFDELPSKGLDHQYSFEELCNSSLMNKTFWSQSEFRLIGNLVDIDTRELVEVSHDELADTSLLKLNHAEHPGQPLHEVINQSFGVLTKNEKQLLSQPHNPRIVRVMYTPSPDDTIRFAYDKLRGLHVPMMEFDPKDPRNAVITGWIGYSLLAVVRLRDGQHSTEFVRTYGGRGENLTGEREPPSIVNNTWSINDRHGKYMLFYGVVTDDPELSIARFPEVSVPMMTENDAQMMKRMESFLDSVMHEDSHQQLQLTPPASSIPKLPLTEEMEDGQTPFSCQRQLETSHPASGDTHDGVTQDTKAEKRKRKRLNKKRRRDARENEVEDRQPPGPPRGPDASAST
ncbi:hypothetical protein FANTH_12961 [Fusarium anthophilum]|uniref:Uncharacterized protein n=1 Tax=Fusarium anthophilum TaxID=48485 RepID=A0A8H4YRD5_9HYPO|nr:hypothetical protein FANTH_12961 [Fusarium anthophilum]